MPTPAPPPLSPGDQLGPYRILRRLGQGGMGTVFEAVDVGLNRRLALKVIASDVAGDPLFRARFTREAQAQASLDSPHVVQVFAYGEVDGRLYIASQLIPDGDLGAMLRAHGAPPPRIAVSMMAQVADGLAEAHRVGLVHRDIKPANVLLRNRGDSIAAYLGDFGIARRVDGVSGLTTDGFTVGTPSYMAPELHTGGVPGPLSDLYSLGCLLWACLVGTAPYPGTTDYQVVTAHVSAPVPQLQVTGPFGRELNRILATALAKDPARRYPSAAALRDDLRALERNLPAPAGVHSGRPPGGPPSLAPTAGYAGGPAGAPGVRRHRSRVGWIVAAAVAAVLLLGGGAAVAVVLAGDDGDEDRGASSTATPGDPGGAPSGDPSGDPSGSASETTSGAPAPGGDEQTAIDNIAAALGEDPEIDQRTATCVATELVDSRGVDGLQEAGFIDADLQVVTDGSGVPDADLLSEVFTLAFNCVLDSADLG
ncbi:serine/threonine-protein kinase [Nocardioides sambongensis]|uniref:serine/threonine-protein kinase n=1 Tax=Nocardioides sambongensis TaxID=2589074 RepID=UPI0011287740|nr:serine/threonine-protein kinase [Nocardioides sambongensis]